VSIVALLYIKADFRVATAGAAQPLLAAIGEGMRWLWGKPLIRYMAFLTGGLNFVNAAVPLIVIVLATQMGASAVDIGLIFSIGGFGGILGALFGGRIQRRFTFGQVIVFVIGAEAVLFPLYLVAPHFLWLGVIYALIYTLGPVYNVVQFSYRLSIIPDALQGRVNSTFRLLAFGLTPLGAALAGVLLQYAGATWTIVAFAAWYVALALLTAANRDVRTAPRHG
jgi:predicted MFS family arabinose efflux permease